MQKILLLGLLLFAVLVPPLSAASSPLADLVFMTEHYPPSNYLEGDQLRGASVEVLKLVWKQLGIAEQEIELVPWARGYDQVQRQKNHVLFSMARSDAREKLFKWAGPIFVTEFLLVGMVDKELPIMEIDDAKNYIIGALRDDITEISLLERGFSPEKIYSRSNLEANIQKLLNGRIELICQSRESLRDMARNYGRTLEDFKVYGVIKKIPLYYAFNREIDDAVVATYQQALDAIDAERRAIVTAYGLTP